MSDLIECLVLGLIACILAIGVVAVVWAIAAIIYTFPYCVLIPLGIFTVGVLAKGILEQ